MEVRTKQGAEETTATNTSEECAEDDVMGALSKILSEPVGTKARNRDEVPGTDTRDHVTGVVVGEFVGHDGAGNVLVDYPGNATGHPIRALATCRTERQDEGRRAVLMFEAGDPGRPIVAGLIQQPDLDDVHVEGAPDTEPLDVQLDGERLTLTADKEIVLRCGKASITLTRAGKILIRGAYLLSRSSGANRIKGGSVQVN